MEFQPQIHHRRSIRLRDYDYSLAGAYFVTVCASQRESVFGEVVNGRVVLNEMGNAVAECWWNIPGHFPNTELDAFVTMPNHVHGIIVINDFSPVGATHASPGFNASPGVAKTKPTQTRATHASPLRPGPQRGSIGAIVGSFKSTATKRINAIRNTAGVPAWQRNYFERVIRDDLELDAIRQYIGNNPAKWDEDENHPGRWK